MFTVRGDLIGLADDAFIRKHAVRPGLTLIEPLNDGSLNDGFLNRRRRAHPDAPAQKIRHPRNVRILPRSGIFD